ncbi:MAG: neutral zinc metallopeptidase [Solirubrobacteraceae bacterium]|nr:neutral zinc metallopeptidase [Solirubrobacteraceae bacterium]
MKWNRVEGAGDMVDARGSGRGRGAAVGAGGLGIGGVIVVLLLQALTGVQFDIPNELDGGSSVGSGSVGYPSSPEEDELAAFTNAVSVENQDMWTSVFQSNGKTYERAKVVRFSRGVSTGCGEATSATGPFYCPADQRVYLDMSFYAEMREQLGADGDFAWAYVVAHELGHHVQNLTGVFDATQKQEREDPGSADGAQGLSVRTELQADCYAGVWAHAAFKAGELVEGDLDEAFGAAEAVGDDRLQSQGGRGTVLPDTFTHGTSTQRRTWFTKGYTDGTPAVCDTFSPDQV